MHLKGVKNVHLLTGGIIRMSHITFMMLTMVSPSTLIMAKMSTNSKVKNG